MKDTQDHMTTELPMFNCKPFHQVEQFHHHFEFPIPSNPQLPDPTIFQSRIEFLQEEADELYHAYNEMDLVGVMDAVLDLIYVAIGTGLYAGLSAEMLEAGFNAVHKANMQKVKVAHAGESKRGIKWDAKKPSGWIAPEHELARILVSSPMV
jgi:predicted HAD superfamily Cof-like phosphohydrolase